MNTPRTLLLLALGISMAACAPTNKLVALKVDTSQYGGGETEVKLQVPGDWYQSTKKFDRAAFSAPDNFSSLNLSIAPAPGGAENCPALARRVAEENVAGLVRGNKAIKVEYVEVAGSPEVTDFRLTVPASPPGPSDKYTQGRVLCRRGAVAAVTCATGINRKETTGQDCLKSLASLTIEQAGAAPSAPVPGTATVTMAAQPAAVPSGLAQPNTPNMNDRRWENVLAQADKDLGATRDQWKFEYAGDSRYVFSAGAKSVEYLLYCSYGNCAWSSDLLARAAFDMSCNEIKVSVLGDATRGVEGCGKKVSYTFNPFNKSWEGGK